MIQALQGLGYGIIGLAVMIGIGIVVLTQLGTAVGGTAHTTVNTIAGYLGTGTGGLASWIPVIIVLVIGMLFLGAFMSKNKA